MACSVIHFPDVLFVIRHGQTDWNLQKKLQGRKDIPLNETGRKQALANGTILRNLLAREAIPLDSVAIKVSPLTRAMQTAQIVCREAHLPGKSLPVDGLKEQSYGLLEGMTHDEIREKYPHCWYMRLHDPLSYTPPEGEAGSLFQERISAVIDACTQTTLLVGHFGLLRTLMALCQTQGIRTNLNFEILTGNQNVVYMVRDGVLTLHGKDEIG